MIIKKPELINNSLEAKLVKSYYHSKEQKVKIHDSCMDWGHIYSGKPQSCYNNEAYWATKKHEFRGI